MRFFEKELIGPADNPLITRYKIIATERFGNLDLHVFHRSDADRCLHDHPWAFVSLILWRGYTEVLPTWENRHHILSYGGDGIRWMAQTRERRWPGMILYRPANWTHRVELPEGKKAVTLIWTSPRRTDRDAKVGDWGFYTPKGWTPWRQYTQGPEQC